MTTATRPAARTRGPAAAGGPAVRRTSMARALNLALAHAMASDDSVVVLGADAGRWSDAPRITDGLREAFGEQRCLDTPLTGAGIVGMAVGMAVSGLRPVVEARFDVFAPSALGQVLEHVAEMRDRARDLPALPVVVRVPYGGAVGRPGLPAWGGRGAPPGLAVAAPSTVEDAYSLLRDAVDHPDPVVLLEPEHLYRSQADVALPVRTAPLGRAELRRAGSDATLIAHGACVPLALRAAEAAAREGREVEVIDLRGVAPLDEETVAAHVRGTGRAVVVAEGPGFAPAALETAARLTERCFPHLRAPVRHVAVPGPECPPPVPGRLRTPGVDRVLDALDDLWAKSP